MATKPKKPDQEKPTETQLPHGATITDCPVYSGQKVLTVDGESFQFATRLEAETFLAENFA